MIAIVITVILSAIAGILWALCAAGTSAEDIRRVKEIKKDENT